MGGSSAKTTRMLERAQCQLLRRPQSPQAHTRDCVLTRRRPFFVLIWQPFDSFRVLALAL